MKIDESCIDRIVVKLVQNITDNIYEFSSDDSWQKTALGEINGIINMAEELKKVLKA